jgi:hypothetical protein
MAKPRNILAQFLAEYSFGVLLASLLLIIVAAPLTKRISHNGNFHARIGQMLLVVMMARLVGLHMAPVSSRHHQPVVFETSKKPHHKS